MVYVNEAAARQLGYAREEMIGMSMLQIHPDITQESWDAAWAAMDQDREANLRDAAPHQGRPRLPGRGPGEPPRARRRCLQLLVRARHHRATPDGTADAPGREDGGHRSAGRRHCPRFQQPTGGDRRLRGHPPRGAQGPSGAGTPGRGHCDGCQARLEPHVAASGLLPTGQVPVDARGSSSNHRRSGAHARAEHRQADPHQHQVRRGTRRHHRRSDAAAERGAEPGHQRPGRHAGRRGDDVRDGFGDAGRG